MNAAVPAETAAAFAVARVALVGNPNSGKTALFNALTGSRQKVANYAGVTVERKEGQLKTASGGTPCNAPRRPTPKSAAWRNWLTGSATLCGSSPISPAAPICWR